MNPFRHAKGHYMEGPSQTAPFIVKDWYRNHFPSSKSSRVENWQECVITKSIQGSRKTFEPCIYSVVCPDYAFQPLGFMKPSLPAAFTRILVMVER